MGTSESKHEKETVPSTQSPKEDKYIGLENFGNTCYCNSVLQCLFYCLPFRDSIEEWARDAVIPSSEKSKDPGILDKLGGMFAGASPVPHSNLSLLLALGKLFGEIKKPKRQSSLRPSQFIATLRGANEIFRSDMQQDAHEFLMFLLNDMSDGLEKHTKENQQNQNSTLSVPTFIQHIFQGTFSNETKCLTCECITTRDEKFFDIPVDVESNSSVTHCLAKISQVERLTGQNKFYCENCHGLQEAEKCTKLKHIPTILILHLKRFKYSESLSGFVKLSYRVSFPMHLRLPILTAKNVTFSSPYDPNNSHTLDQDHLTSSDTIQGFNSDPLYKLLAIVIHIGDSANSGHYVSVIRVNTSWYIFDDHRVKHIVDTEPLLSQCFGSWNHHPDRPQNSAAGYILFYERVDSALPNLQLNTT